MSLMGEADNERAHTQRLVPGGKISLLLEQHAEIRDAFGAVRASPEPRPPFHS